MNEQTPKHDTAWLAPLSPLALNWYPKLTPKPKRDTNRSFHAR